MRSRNKKTTSNISLFHPAIITFIGIIIIVSISVPLTKNISQKYKVNDDITNLESEIALIENQNTKLNKMIDYFESDQFTEKQARLNFGLKKKGENVIVIQDAKSKEKKEINNEIDVSDHTNYSNTQEWFIYFFKKK